MLRSVRSQIVAATSLIIVLILGATAYFVIDQKIREINQDIFTKAVSFAELTHERITANYEDNYRAQAYANFDREMAEIYSLNPDITEALIFNYNGETLYQAGDSEKETVGPDELERLQAVWPSARTKTGRIVYLEKDNGRIRYANFNGREVDPVKDTEAVADIVYPFRDQNNVARSYSIRYRVNYNSLADRVQSTVMNILFMAVAGIAIAIFIGGMVAGRITSPIKKLTQGAEKIGKGDFKTRIDVKSRSEIGLLADTFNKMATDLEKSTEVLVEKEKMGHELALAGEIQKMLLPKTMPIIAGLDIAASLKSATEVGGDCYDFLLTSKNELLFYIADVTGHGVPAGIVSAINNALVPALIDHYEDTKEMVEHLNKILRMKTRPNMFMTMVMAKWTKKGQLAFTQAGHDPILHYQSGAKKVRTLNTGGMALAMIDDISKITKTETIDIAAGDTLVFYTDGIPEAWKNEKENYGMDAFRASVEKHAALGTAQEIHDALLKDVRDFMGTYPQQDDITLIVVKRTE